MSRVNFYQSSINQKEKLNILAEMFKISKSERRERVAHFESCDRPNPIRKNPLSMKVFCIGQN